MKGVILAGGLGTRLRPLTDVTNKHLLPVWDKPMIYYPIEYLVKSGISEVLIVTGGSHAGDFLALLKNGEHFGLKKIEYAYQNGEGGIADALKLAEGFAGSSPICVVLGDNVYQKAIPTAVDNFKLSGKKAAIFTQTADDYDNASRFGIAFCERSTQSIAYLEEKPHKTRIADWCNWPGQSCHIVTGTYLYTPEVFKVCDTLEPSERNELEITDVNRWFMREDQLAMYSVDGWWVDAGTFSSLSRASRLVQGEGANHAG